MFPKDVRSVAVWNSLRAVPWPHLHLHFAAQSLTMASRNGCGQLGSGPCCSPTTAQKACGRAQVLAGMQAWHQSQVSAGINHAGSHTGVPMTPHGPGQSKDSNRCCRPFTALCPCHSQPQMEQLCAGLGLKGPAASGSVLLQKCSVQSHPGHTQQYL